MLEIAGGITIFCVGAVVVFLVVPLVVRIGIYAVAEFLPWMLFGWCRMLWCLYADRSEIRPLRGGWTSRWSSVISRSAWSSLPQSPGP